ncbi:methyltransferase [Bacillus sonorensis]|uniref:class I SAM-dependent methyltransferase n=1 Tax=Bacillus TaxID=1386 RepID=UPI000497BEF3|nr:class I SAM-dependent methyltransferase [Bacillus sonorensis]MCF7620045.1 class I SAM-dependent methyltransferase [Bacillus sonorensis]MCY7857159.1 class I SAM-dependent methyltransferase [Bacillus sonorensis]MCY8034514.1 class I SAM-dependent methyltransferase [Bacillus sonorensis]MCY8086609.1 class I SAM-dependent methyltransferase [Bacillus sonorensis]MCY8270606.1 class I SAM-dependent methyltransferase [Bacillus sonorensis]
MNMDWNHLDVYQYREKIALKIPCYRMLYDMMDRLLTVRLNMDEANVAVVGAGGGQELLTLGKRHPNWSFTGVDTSAHMLNLAQQRLKFAGIQLKADFIEGEVGQLEHQYDAATCMLVLHFVRDKRKFLQDIAARLPQGAPFSIASINGDIYSETFSWQMKAWKEHMLANGISEQEWGRFADSIGKHSHPIPALEVEALLEESGFTNVTRFFSAYLIDGWFAVKGGGKC